MRAAWLNTGSPICFRHSTWKTALLRRRRRRRRRRRSSATWTAFTTRTIPEPSSSSPARRSTSWSRPQRWPPAATTRRRPGLRRQGDGGLASSRWDRGTISGTTSATSSSRGDDAIIHIFFMLLTLRNFTTSTVILHIVAGDYYIHIDVCCCVYSVCYRCVGRTLTGMYKSIISVVCNRVRAGAPGKLRHLTLTQTIPVPYRQKPMFPFNYKQHCLLLNTVTHNFNPKWCQCGCYAYRNFAFWWRITRLL